MTKIIMRFLDSFQWLFKLLKVDYHQFRIILWAKLTMDNRRTYASYNPSKKDQQYTNALVKSLFINAIIGLFIGLSIIYINSVFLAMTIVFAIIMLMTALSLVTDFTSVLLDTTDNAILLFRPVDSRTFLTARITHISAYLFMVTMSFGLATLVIGTKKFGLLFLPGFIFTLFFSTLLVVFLTNLFYMVLMKFTTGETFKDIILYIQIFTGLLFMAGYQILPRVIDISKLKNLTVSINWWSYLFPPAWMAGTLEGIATRNLQTPYLILMALTIFVPLISIIVVIRYLGPAFSQKISQMEIAMEKTTGKNKGIFRREISSFCSTLFARTPTEKTGFEMTWKLASRDRKFKLNTYPTFGAVIIIIYFVVVAGNKNILNALGTLPQTNKYIFLIYLSFFLLLITITHLSSSDNYQASWIYLALPIKKPGEILTGALKSMIVKYIFPFVFISFIILAVWGIGTLDDIVLGFLNLLFFCVLISLVTERSFPFSRKHTVMETNLSRKMIPSFLVLLLFVILACIHYFVLLDYKWGVLAAIPVMVVLVVWLFRIYKKTPWKKIVG
ncbi:hypothetical protein ACFLRT_03120 [Acidobacteriota bacterium]